MSPFFARNAGLIELTLVEGIVLLVAVRELWSVRRSLRKPRPGEQSRSPDAPGPPGDDQRPDR